MKVCIATGSRSEYYLLKNLIIELYKDSFFEIKLLVTGAHISKNFGNTIKDIKKDNIKINKIIKLPIMKGTPNNIAKSFGVGVEKTSLFLRKLNPDLLIVLGDRYEIFATVIAAYINRIPIAHIHGGEKTEGSMDEGFRHSITKLSNYHFVSNYENFKRVKQLGENEENIFNVGSLGVESIKKTKFLKKEKLEEILKIKFKEKIVLVNYHSDTLTKSIKKSNFKSLLIALKKLKNYTVIFTMPSADVGYIDIVNQIQIFVKENKNSYFIKSLGHKLFFSLCQYIDFMIGNSSSGIIEFPSFKKPTINLGLRQKGRLKPVSVIDANYNYLHILKKIKIATSTNFKKKIYKIKNPYDGGFTSKKILKNLKKIKKNNIILKKFNDII